MTQFAAAVQDIKRQPDDIICCCRCFAELFFYQIALITLIAWNANEVIYWNFISNAYCLLSVIRLTEDEEFNANSIISINTIISYGRIYAIEF